MFPTRIVGTLKKLTQKWLYKNKIICKKNTKKEALYLTDPTKLTESFQPCLAACHVESAQLQN